MNTYEADIPCQKAIDLGAFLTGLFEVVRPCSFLRQLLDLEQRQAPFPIVLTMLMNGIERQKNIAIPLSMLDHFQPYAQITKENALEILSKHLRYVDINLKYLFINPKTPCTIRVHDFEPVEPRFLPDVELIPSSIGKVCHHCTRFFAHAEYEKHVALGPFSSTHVMGSNTDLEIRMLLALNTFNFISHQASCKFCSTVYNLKYHSSELSAHAILHASHSLLPNDTLTEGKRKLWSAIKKIDGSDVQICLPCNRIFANMRFYYLHLVLFSHSIAKNICLGCRIVYNGLATEHIAERHDFDQRCPFICDVGPNILSHHMYNSHPNIDYLVPAIEADKIRINSQQLSFSNVIIGEYGQIKLDRIYWQRVLSLCSAPIYGLSSSVRYTYIDDEGWKIASRVLSARESKNVIKSEYRAPINRNLFRILTKIILKNQFKNSGLKREESLSKMFLDEITMQENFAEIYHSNIHYNDAVLQNYDVIIAGNHNFKNISSTVNMRILNFSIETPSIWKFNSSGAILPDVNNEYGDYIFHMASRLPKDTEHTFVIECSLHPWLITIPTENRARTLQSSIENLAHGFLKLAVQIQKICKHTAITTCLHVTNSSNYAEEMIYMNQFNEILKTAALTLQLGLVDIANIGIFTSQFQHGSQHYRVNTSIIDPIIENNGKLTVKGKGYISNLIFEFEQEKRLLINQVKQAELTYTEIESSV